MMQIESFVLRAFFFVVLTVVAIASSTALTSSENLKNGWFGKLGRLLQEDLGDFERLNQLLQSVSIIIDDDMTVSEKIGFTNLELVVDSLVCRDISIGNLILNHNTEDTVVSVDLAFDGVDAACDIVYQYEYGFLKGTGKAEIITGGNAATASIEFTPADEVDNFVVKSSVTDCVVDVEISDVNFIDADLATTIVGLFEPYLRDLIEKEIEGFACSEFSTTGVPLLDEAIFELIAKTFIDFTSAKDVGGQENQVPETYDTENALNFQDIADTSIGNMFQVALDQIDDRFGTSDTSEPGINSFLRSFVLDDSGALVIKVDEFFGEDLTTFQLHDKFTKTTITFTEARIYGLDSMTVFEPLQVVGDYTVRNEFAWKSLGIEIDVDLKMQPSSRENVMLHVDDNGLTENTVMEKLTLRVGANNVDVVASLMAIIDREALGVFTIGSVLSLTNTEDFSWILPCLLSAVEAVEFTELTIKPQTINSPSLEGFLDDGVDRFLSDLATIAFEIYHDALVENVLPRMFQTTIKSFVNSQISSLLINAKDDSNPCPKYDVEDDFVDFREFFDPSSSSNKTYGKLPAMLRAVLDNQLIEVDSNTGMPKINEVLIDTLTREQSGIDGSLSFGGKGTDLFHIKQRINIGGFDAEVRVRASNVLIENLDTIVAPLVILDAVPTEPYFLNNSITIGLEERPVKMSGGFMFSVLDDVSGTEISNELNISFDMHAANMIVTTMVKIVKSRLLMFPLVDVFNLNCWIATIPSPTLNEQGVAIDEDEVKAAIVDFAASVANMNLNLTCIECSSPGIIQMSELLMSSDEAQNDVTFLANSLLLSAAEMARGDLMQVQIDRLLNDASMQCPHSPDYDPDFVANRVSSVEKQYEDFEAIDLDDSTMYLVVVGLISLGLILFVAIVIIAIRIVTYRRHHRWLNGLPTEKLEALKEIQRKQDSLELAVNTTTESMFLSGEQIPFLIRWGMPIIILGNIALFLSGHLNLGATVKIEASIAGETMKVDDFFEFSVAKSTIDIWNAGGKALAILILIFSGVWPYTKQLVTLILWFTPTSWVSVSRRGCILLWLDRLAKWSMIDIFVLIVCLAAFRVSVNSPSNFAFLPEEFYSFDLLVVPLWGLYANLIAQLVSQISSHVMIHYHRKIAKVAHDSYNEKNGHVQDSACTGGEDRTILRTHRFGRPHRGEEEKLVIRSWTSTLIVTLVICSIACVIAGCVLPSFAIEVFGLLGIAVEAGQEFQEATTYHSVFTVIQLLFDEARFLGTVKDFIGLGSFSIIFAITVLLMPIIQSIALLGHWFLPMTKRQRRKMFVLNEIFQAWQYAEVYIIAIFVASWQLGPISSFMVNSYCGSLDSFFSELVFYGILQRQDAQCFSVKSTIEEGFFILAAGAVILGLINTFITKATYQYFRDADEPFRQLQLKEISAMLEIAENGLEKSTDDGVKSIRPIPVLFSDTFRWLLIGDKLTTTTESRSESVEISCIPTTSDSEN